MVAAPSKIRVLIVDNNMELCETLADYFGQQMDMQVVGTAYDGEVALERIQELLPDVVILDITMPLLDGLAVLERLDSLGLPEKPKVVVLTAFGRDDIIAKFTDLGADYFIVKPFELEVLTQRVRQFSGRRQPSTATREVPATYKAKPSIDIEADVTHILHEMGVPAHFKGYNYLRDAVLTVLRQDRLLGGSLTKELYPYLANKYHSTPGGVEAAIRNAVIAAWENGNREFLVKLTGRVGRRDRFPTNSLIIAKIADHIRLEQRSDERTLPAASPRG